MNVKNQFVVVSTICYLYIFLKHRSNAIARETEVKKSTDFRPTLKDRVGEMNKREVYSTHEIIKTTMETHTTNSYNDRKANKHPLRLIYH